MFALARFILKETKHLGIYLDIKSLNVTFGLEYYYFLFLQHKFLCRYTSKIISYSKWEKYFQIDLGKIIPN